jgi:hypothetical protein
MSRSLEKLFFRRPRVLNLFHWANFVNATSQTIPAELEALERHAARARQALEIGTDQGVSAARIAGALARAAFCTALILGRKPRKNQTTPAGQSANGICDVRECMAAFASYVATAGK